MLDKICENCGSAIQFWRYRDGICESCGNVRFRGRKKRYNHFSYSSLLSIYLLLKAARKGATRVEISNDCFRSEWDVKKVYEKRIHRFAKSLRPFFTSYQIAWEQKHPNSYGKNMLILYLDEEDDGSGERKTECIESLPNQNQIDKELAVEVIELTAINIGDAYIEK